MTPNEFTTQLELAVESRDRDAMNMLEQLAYNHPELKSIWDEHQRLEQAINSWKTSQPKVQLSAAVMDQLKSDSVPVVRTGRSTSAEGRRNVSTGLLTLISGSLAMFIVSLAIWNQFRPQVPTTETIANNTDNEQKPNPKIQNRAKADHGDKNEDAQRINLTGLFREAGSSYKSLADDTMGSIADGAVLTASLQPASNNWTSLSDIYAWPEESVNPVSDWTQPLERAMDYLLPEAKASDSAG